MRYNRFKKTKQKQQKQHKRQKKQTKHKRRMQYGGKIYNCLDYSRILKKDAPEKKVVIPGYAEINDMIKEYEKSDEIQQQLDAGIKGKNVVVYTSCENPRPDTPDTTIILLKKDGFFSFASSSIDCDDKTYLTLASHNFKIFIEDILKWNPFLPKTNNHKKTEPVTTNQFQGPTRYIYNTEYFPYEFINEEWWNSQQWWNAYKVSMLPTYASLVPTPTPPLRPTSPIAMESSPQEQRDADEVSVSLMDDATVRRNLRVLRIHLRGLQEENKKLRDQITQLTQLTRGETKKDK
jgi:hypothetical protein